MRFECHRVSVAKLLATFLLTAFVSSHAVAEEPSQETDTVLLIQNVYVVTADDLNPDSVSMVLIRNGLIAEVGDQLQAPKGAKTIDGDGGKLTPGWIDSASRLWMTDLSKSDTSATSALRSVDGIDPFSQEFHHAVSDGVTSTVVTLSSGGRLGGDVALVAAAPMANMFDSSVADASAKEASKETKKDNSKKEKKADEKPTSKDTDAKADPKMPADPKVGAAKKTKKADDPDAKDADKNENDKKEAEKKDTDTKEPDEKKDADKKEDGKKDADKKEDDEKIEVAYTPAKPELPFSSGKAGWVLSEDIGIAASLGVAARDGKGRFDEFNALKKTLKDAEAYHEKWDEYRSWKAKQDLLPPDKRAKAPEPKKASSSMDARRAELMRRIAAMRAARSGGATPSTPPAEKPKEDAKAKQDDGDKKDDKKDEKVVAKPKFEAAKDRLRPILRGERPLRISVSDSGSLRRALELADIASVRLVLVGLTDVPAGEIESLRWPIVLGPWVNQDQDVIDRWVECLETYEGRFSIGTFGNRGVDSGWLRMQAAAAIAAGVDPGRVLDAVTRSAADMGGVGNWLGEIRAGQRADLTLFAGDPLDPATPVLQTWVSGESVYQANGGDNEDAAIVNDASSQTVTLSPADRTELAEIRLPQFYALASNRILSDDGSLQPGIVTIRDGVITSVRWSDGDAEPVPSDDAPTLQLGDLVVMPGLVTASLTVSNVFQQRGAQEPDAGYFRAADRFDPSDRPIRQLTQEGVLWAALTPPSDNVVAGQVAAVRLAAREPICDASIADLFVVANDARSNDRYPASLEGQFNFIRKRFAGDLQTNRTQLPSFLARELQQDTMARYAELSAGNRRALVRAESDAEIRGAVRLIEDLGLSAAMVAPRQLGPFLDEILEADLGIVMQPSNAGDQPWYVQEIIAAAEGGACIGIAASTADDLRMTAAMLIRHGLDPNRVNKILTSEGAGCVGMPEGSATIREGQPADLTVWTAPPGRLTGRCVSVLVDGQNLSTRTESTSTMSPVDANRISGSVR